MKSILKLCRLEFYRYLLLVTRWWPMHDTHLWNRDKNKSIYFPGPPLKYWFYFIVTENTKLFATEYQKIYSTMVLVFIGFHRQLFHARVGFSNCFTAIRCRAHIGKECIGMSGRVHTIFDHYFTNIRPKANLFAAIHSKTT